MHDFTIDPNKGSSMNTGIEKDSKLWSRNYALQCAWLNLCYCVFWLHVLVCCLVDQELSFQDKYLFYRFLDDEEEDTPLPSEEEKRESEEELPETILSLAQIGPDALLRMILRKSSVVIIKSFHFPAISLHIFVLLVCWHVESPLIRHQYLFCSLLSCQHILLRDCFEKGNTLWRRS